MSRSKIAGIAVAALLFVGPAAFAQGDDPAPAPEQQPVAQAKTQSTDSAALQTFSGCLMSESAYRKAHNLGDGAVNGVGLGDEVVLVDAKVSAATGTAASATSSGAPTAPATALAATCADKGTAYRITGTLEDKMKAWVGHNIEVTGRFKHADDVALAGGTPSAAKLPAEVEVVSYREASARAEMTEPARPATPPATVEPPSQPQGAAATTPAPAERRELPHTAGSTSLIAVVGALALSAAAVLTLRRRRAF